MKRNLALGNELRKERHSARIKLEEICFKEEIKWAQKSKGGLSEGDSETKFFQSVVLIGFKKMRVQLLKILKASRISSLNSL